MAKYRKKPVEIEAMAWPGKEGTPFDDWLTAPDHGTVSIDHAAVDDEWDDLAPLLIRTLEGVMTAQPGDYVIRGVQGELYPCKPDIFEATYEPADGEQPCTAIVAIDTETDGLHPGRRAWEIGMVRRDESGERECRMFLPLDLKFSDPAALRIGGFWDRHPVGRKLSGKLDAQNDTYAKPCEPVTPAHDAAKKVMAWTFGATIVGANPAFDAVVLERLLRSEGYLPQWHYRLLDVEAMTAGYVGSVVGGLADCCKLFDIPRDGAHTALGDARDALRIFDRIIGGGAS